jgi:MoaA/NifB/PqqE/SkfB family radical SAM enzyme
MKVALVFPPVYGVDFPHLGLAYIAAKIREEKHDVKVFCFNSRLYAESGGAKHLWDWPKADLWLNADEIKKHLNIEKIAEDWAEEVLAYGPQAIGFGVNTHSRMMANLVASRIKKGNPRIPLIYGGPFCSSGLDLRDERNADVDVFVRGEGEDIIGEVLRRIALRQPLTGIKGTVTREGGLLQDNGENNMAVPIANIPFPAFDLFDMKAYDNKKEIPIIFSRGCNYRCRFCSDKPIWGNYRMRSAEDIVEEIKKHKAQYGRTWFKSNDLLVNGDLKGLERLADLLIREKLDITWGGMARARKDMSSELFKKIKDAGCLYLTFGIESGSDKILKLMGKPSTEEASLTMKRAYEAGIKVNTLWMVGHPKETTLDVIRTMGFLFRNRKYIEEFVNVSPCYIPENSMLHQEAADLGIEYDPRGHWFIKKEGNFHRARVWRAKALRFLAKMLGLYKGGITSNRDAKRPEDLYKKDLRLLRHEIKRDYLFYFSRLFNRVLVGPDMIQIMMTSRCNIRCKICNVWKQKHDHEMTTEEVKRVIDQGIALGAKHIYFTGGEALLRADIFELIGYAQRPGVVTTLNTNGSPITEEVAKKIVRSKLRSLSFSIDSADPEVHDSIRGKGVFEKAVQAMHFINHFKKEYKRRIEDNPEGRLDLAMCSVIMKCNVKGLPDLARFAKKMRCCYIAFQPIVDNNDLAAYADFKSDFLLEEPDVADLRETFKELDAMKREALSGDPHIDFMAEKTEQHFKRTRAVNTCFAGFSRIFVGPAGDASFVCMESIGNIREHSLAELWFSKKAWQLRKRIKACRSNCTQFCSERPASEKLGQIHKNFFRQWQVLRKRHQRPLFSWAQKGRPR